MHLIRSAQNGRERIRDGETPITVPVPIDAHLHSARRDDFFAHELHKAVSPQRRSVTHRIAQNDGGGAAANCGRIEPLDRLGVGAHGIFGHEHGRKVMPHREAHGLFNRALQIVGGPVFDEPSNGARTQERRRFDGNPGAL